MTNEPLTDEPIRGKDDLFAIFRESIKPKDAWRIGAEMEKFGVDAKSGAPIGYDGPRGVLAILERLAKDFGWAPEREREGGPIIALLRDGASVTLEPGSQLELSGAPHETIHAVADEFKVHMGELSGISKDLGLAWLGLGFHPFAKRSDLTFVPKQRYAIMREYLPTKGAHALDMMLRTATVQANYDYASEADAMKKMRVALKLSPLTTALFANSPLVEGAAFGGVTYRGRVWLDVDPDRSGLVPRAWEKGATFESYVDWALGVPMFLFKRNGEAIKNTGQTFESFWKDGFQGHRPTLGDWQTHLNTLFPEVRLKKTIEVRGADSQGTELASALPALWTGILYDDAALDEADALTSDFTHAEVSEFRHDACERGVRASFRGTPVQKLAAKVIAIADGGLARRARLRADGADERVHLRPLAHLVDEGRAPADAITEGLGDAPDRRAAVIERARLD